MTYRAYRKTGRNTGNTTAKIGSTMRVAPMTPRPSLPVGKLRTSTRPPGDVRPGSPRDGSPIEISPGGRPNLDSDLRRTTARIQNILHTLGYGKIVGKVDGLIGPKTRLAIRTFQEDWNDFSSSKDLKEDGRWGAAVSRCAKRAHTAMMNAGVRSFRQLLRGGMVSKMKMMPRLRSFAGDVRPGSPRDGSPIEISPGGRPNLDSDLRRTTARIQNILHTLGYGKIVGKVDGLIGPKTRLAIRTFQEDWNDFSSSKDLKEDGRWGAAVSRCAKRAHTAMMNAGVRSFRQLLRGGMVSKMKMMPRLRSFAAIKTAHGRGPMTATPGRKRVPNRSGNPQGYNSKLFRSKEHMAKAFQSLGYKVSMRNPKEDSEAAKKFQNDFNRCSRRFSLRWGVASVNGMISPDTLRALEIALIFSRKRQAKMMEVTKRKVSLADAWHKTCNKSGKGGLGTGNYMIERGYAKNQGSRAFAASRPQPRDSWGIIRKSGSRHSWGSRTKARRWLS